MTPEQAETLQAGDTVYVAVCWIDGTTKVVRTAVRGRGVGYSTPMVVLTSHATQPPERLHHTEAEARADVAAMIRRRVARWQERLAEWEAGPAPAAGKDVICPGCGANRSRGERHGGICRVVDSSLNYGIAPTPETRS